MGLPRPIEVVVIRPVRALALRPRPRPQFVGGVDAGDAADDARPGFSAEQQRELDGVLELLKCPVRQRILLALGPAGPADGNCADGSGAHRGTGGEPLNVTALARCTETDQKTLSHHLAHLRTAGLIFSQRRGRSIFYEPAPGRVVYRRGAGGGLALLVTTRGGEVSVTIAVRGTNGAARNGATDGAPMSTD